MSAYRERIDPYDTILSSNSPSIPLLGEAEEFSRPTPLFARLICEAIGTCLFIFFGAGCGAQGEGILAVSIAHALTAMWLIYVFGDVSGAHFNAGPTVCAFIDRKLSIVETICYLVAQGIGSMLAGGLLCAIYSPGTGLGLPELGPDVKVYQGFLLEFICTTILSFVIHFTTSYNTHKEAAFPIGLTVLSCFLLAVGRDGSALNPWRWLAPAVFMNKWDSYAWIYVVGPISGFILGYIIFRIYKYIWQSGSSNRA